MALRGLPSTYNFYAAFSEMEQASLVTEEMRAAPGQEYGDVLNFWEKSSGSLLERLLYTDIKTYLVELCMKQDQMSMAASVESRVPFLDHVLVEFALNIPASLKTRGLTGKRILKAVMKKSLPDAILNRQKLGLPTPYSQWFSGSQVDIVKDLLLEARSLNRELFRAETVRRLLAEHRANYRDHSDKLWRLLNLELWHRVFVDRDPKPLDVAAVRNSVAGDSNCRQTRGSQKRRFNTPRRDAIPPTGWGPQSIEMQALARYLEQPASAGSGLTFRRWCRRRRHWPLSGLLTSRFSLVLEYHSRGWVC